MNNVIWTLITASFLISIAGMIFSSILWSQKSKNVIISAWVRIADKSEMRPLDKDKKEIYEVFLRFFLLSSGGGVSKRKVTYISIFSTLLFSSATIFGTSMKSYIEITFAMKFLLLIFISFPVHWYIEYRYSESFLRSYKYFSDYSLMRSFLISNFIGLFSIIKIILLLFFLSLPTQIFWWIDKSSALSEAISGMYESESKLMMLIYFLKNCREYSTFFMVNSFGVSLLAFTVPGRVSFFSSLIIAFSIIVTLLASSLSVFVIMITHARWILRAAAKFSELAASSNPRAIFSFSSALFALSTGLMQAFSFYYPDG